MGSNLVPYLFYCVYHHCTIALLLLNKDGCVKYTTGTVVVAIDTVSDKEDPHELVSLHIILLRGSKFVRQ